jgi:hypothetical protein
LAHVFGDGGFDGADVIVLEFVCGIAEVRGGCEFGGEVGLARDARAKKRFDYRGKDFFGGHLVEHARLSFGADGYGTVDSPMGFWGLESVVDLGYLCDLGRRDTALMGAEFSLERGVRTGKCWLFSGSDDRGADLALAVVGGQLSV